MELGRKFEESKDDTKINATDKQIETGSKFSNEELKYEYEEEDNKEENKNNSSHSSPKPNSHSFNTGGSFDNPFGKNFISNLIRCPC